MGHICSKTTTTQQGSSSPPHRASVRLNAGRGEQLRIVLSNKSSYVVSYSVIQEDKQIIRSRSCRTNMSIGVGVRAGIFTGGASASADVRGTKEVAVETEGTTEYLTKDQRMQPNGLTGDTEVRFPQGCRELRVYAEFLDEDGHWRCYKNKVYSSIGQKVYFIGQKKRQDVFLTALNANIAPYRICRSDSADLGQQSRDLCKCRIRRTKLLFQDKVLSRTKKRHCRTL